MRATAYAVIAGVLLPGVMALGQATRPAVAAVTRPGTTTQATTRATTVRATTMPATRPAIQYAKPTAPKPTKAVAADGCTTSECHGAVKAYKVLHGPVNVNACDACHKLTNEKEHTYVLQREKAEMCTFCHTVDLKAGPVVHKPVADGQCISCHNPHGGVTKAMTRGATAGELCAQCHQDPSADKRNIHGPVAAGGCDSCHTSHTAKFAKMLNAQGRDLCFTCHAEMRQEIAQVKFPHKALEQDCGTCHDPHASDHKMQVKKGPDELCAACHDKEQKLATGAAHKHSVVTTGQACLNCHNGHGGNLAQLMRDEPVKICLKCHDKPVQAAGGVTVAGVPEVADPKLVKHGPIRDGNCGGCHSPHGSANGKLLAKPYPGAFYQSFSLDKYELCFSCHDKQLVLTAKAQGLTGFRNGQENLHFVHVNKEDKGRSCRACHATHASANELHVREKVPYGKWEMPINYQKTATGGGCSPGCHKPYGYDRDKPVDYAAPTTEPTTAPAASAR